MYFYSILVKLIYCPTNNIKYFFLFFLSSERHVESLFPKNFRNNLKFGQSLEKWLDSSTINAKFAFYKFMCCQFTNAVYMSIVFQYIFTNVNELRNKL